MTKISQRQASLAHWGKAAQEWRAKGWSDPSIRRMLRVGMEHMAVHVSPDQDVIVAMEIADGVRAA